MNSPRQYRPTGKLKPPGPIMPHQAPRLRRKPLQQGPGLHKNPGKMFRRHPGYSIQPPRVPGYTTQPPRPPGNNQPPGPPPPPVNNGGHGPGDPPPPGPHMPIDPYFEAGRRSLDDLLASRLGLLGPQREQIAAMMGLSNARLNTNEGLDQRALYQGMSDRGLYNSGVQKHDLGVLSTDYLRQRQDLANQAASGYGDLAAQEAQARADYAQQLQELLLQSAERSQQDKYAVTPEPRSPKPKPKPKPKPPQKRRRK